MVTPLTRWIQARHGYRPPGPVTCPSCGATRMPVSSFPSSNFFGVAAFAWVAAGLKRAFGRSLRCPNCGQGLTVDEYVDREPDRRPGSSDP